MQIDFSSPEKITTLVLQQDGWTEEEFLDLMRKYRLQAFIDGSAGQVKNFAKLSRKNHSILKRRQWKEYIKLLDEFNDKISILKLEAQKAHA